ncbi:MAG: GDP-perosamine synthase [Phycisphaerae bacterium]|nr:GDP-perosamine synthase [Phycisphaerae bacterium]
MTQEISLSAPDITEAEIQAVVEVMRTPRLSLGPRVPEFEQAFVDRLGVRHAVACNSGTSALHLIWRAMEIGAGDEVITTSFSFIASSNSIMFERGRPVFVDVDPDTWQIDHRQIEAAITPRTRAIMPVDVFGSIPDMDAIGAIARRHKLRVLEDSCEALGSTYKGRKAGTLADAAAFGFYPNKQITTGEGGMIVTDDDTIALRCRSMRNQGRDPDAGWLAHARLGFNYRLPDINCAIGVVQMRRLEEILSRRARVAEWYIERLRDERRVRLQKIPADVHMSWFVFVVRLSDDYSQADRDRIMEALRSRGIGCNNYFTPIHLQPFYGEAFGCHAGDLPRTEALAGRTIALPFHNGLTEGDVERVVREFRRLL